jgi:hypothetical protein
MRTLCGHSPATRAVYAAIRGGAAMTWVVLSMILTAAMTVNLGEHDA